MHPGCHRPAGSPPLIKISFSNRANPGHSLRATVGARNRPAGGDETTHATGVRAATRAAPAYVVASNTSFLGGRCTYSAMPVSEVSPD